MHPDEFFRYDGFGFVAGGFERGKMRVVRYNNIRLRCNRAVAEFIVIRVLHDDSEPELRLDLPDVAVSPIEQFQQRDNFTPAFCAGKFCRDLPVFKQDFIGHCQREPAIQQRAENLMVGLLPPEDLEKNVGVEADRQA